MMTYNVRYFGHAGPLKGAASTRTGIRRITDAIASLGSLPHVICLQEVEMRSLRSSRSHTPSHMNETQLQAVMTSLDWSLHRSDREHRYVPHYFPAHAYRLKNAHLYTTGLAVLVREDIRVDVHDAGRHDITERRRGPTGKLKQTRICAHVTLTTADGTSLDIFNTHLSLPAFFSRDFYRLVHRLGYGANQEREAERLVEFVRSRKQSERFVVVGDFNSLPGSPVYRHMLRELGTGDPFAELTGESPESLRLRWPTAGFLSNRMRIDHVFTGSGLKWLDFEDTHPFGEHGPWDGLSDHVPIVGRFVPEAAVA